MSLLLDILSTQYAYLLFMLVLAIGIYMMVASPNLVKKVIGLNMFQSAIFLFFIAMAYVAGGKVPVVEDHPTGEVMYAAPLPQVIVLTAIVVGVALTAVAMALLVRIYNEYGTLNEDVLQEVRVSDS